MALPQCVINPKFNLLPILMPPRHPRVPAGATHIMETSIQPSHVVILFPTFSLATSNAPTFQS
jgi:hypothetical protein